MSKRFSFLLSPLLGVVQASISLGKLKDAVLAAKECVHIFPLCSTAHLLLGQTLSKAAQESALGEVRLKVKITL